MPPCSSFSNSKGSPKSLTAEWIDSNVDDIRGLGGDIGEFDWVFMEIKEHRGSASIVFFTWGEASDQFVPTVVGKLPRAEPRERHRGDDRLCLRAIVLTSFVTVFAIVRVPRCRSSFCSFGDEVKSDLPSGVSLAMFSA